MGNGGVGNGGTGAVGGAGGNANADAGVYNTSNSITAAAFSNSAGITQATMNTGHASLIQHSVNIQANVNVR